MHPKALLEQAVELLRAVLRFEQPADAMVSAHFRRQHSLGARDRHALAETVYASAQQAQTSTASSGGNGAADSDDEVVEEADYEVIDEEQEAPKA